KQALEYVASYCGVLAESVQDFKVTPEEDDKRAALEVGRFEAEAKEKEGKLQDVQSLFEKSVGISGTQGETYLRKVRGIKGELPEALRYLSAGTTYAYKGEMKKIYSGAMASFARDRQGNLRGVAMTYLKDGARGLDQDG